jgi:hypothetical protein
MEGKQEGGKEMIERLHHPEESARWASDVKGVGFTDIYCISLG